MTSFFVTLTLNEVKGKGLKEILRYAQNDVEGARNDVEGAHNDKERARNGTKRLGI